MDPTLEVTSRTCCRWRIDSRSLVGEIRKRHGQGADGEGMGRGHGEIGKANQTCQD